MWVLMANVDVRGTRTVKNRRPHRANRRQDRFKVKSSLINTLYSRRARQ